MFALKANSLSNLKFYKVVLSQFSNELYGIASTTIGIKAWFTPQISEHWPV